MSKLAATVEDRLDNRYGQVVNALRQEWRDLMAYPPSEDRTKAADVLLDRANMLGIGRLDRP